MPRVILALGVLALAAPAAGHAQWSEEAAIRAAVQHYVLGHATGDGNHYRQVFYLPEAKLYWVRDGQLGSRTSEEYAAGAAGKPAADEAKRKRSVQVLDVAGNTALVKVDLDYPDVHFTDYMSMLKLGGEWKIINKSFDRGAPGPAVPSLETERGGIQAALDHYIQGHRTGVGDHMRTALHPVAKLYWVRDDVLAQRLRDEYAAGFPGKPSPDAGATTISSKILDAVGTAAVARVDLEFPAGHTTDFMTLLKVGGQWQIVSKTFYRELKAK